MKIDPKPEKPPAISPNDARYYDERDLEGELRRVFEICHGCRMCVNYCGAFPDMFARVDRDIDAGSTGAERLAFEDFEKVTDLCWQCKLCYIKCPYTPDEEHEWAVDIPHLLTREKSQRTRRNGMSLQDAALGEPGLLGSLTTGLRQGPVANFVNASRLVRKAMQVTAGISENFPLPPFATTTFERWLESHDPLPEAGTRGEIAIFATCQGDYNLPAAPANAVRVLEKNGFKVIRPSQVCCGIPNIDGGDLDAARHKARTNVASLLEQIALGRKIVVPGPSCSYTIRKEYPELLGKEAEKVAASTFDLMEFLESLRKERTLNRDFKKSLGRIAYHAPCHLRAQKIGFPGARVLAAVPETEVEIVQECSAVDGTWGMKAQYYEMGRKYARRLVDGIERVEAETVVSDCPLAGLRIAKENRVTVRHPVEALADAYGISVGLT